VKARSKLERREHGCSGIENWVADVGRKVLGTPPVRPSREVEPRECLARRKRRRVEDAALWRQGKRDREWQAFEESPRSECHLASTAQAVTGSDHDRRCSGQGIGFALNRAFEEVSWRFGSNALA
jgi:hypothetical protein